MAKVYCVVFLGVVAAVLSTASALSDDEKKAIKAIMAPVLADCSKEHGISKEELIAARKAKDINAVNPCFYACFFKKIGILSDEGLYLPEVAKDGHQKFLNDAELVSKLNSVSDICTAVNEKEVSDGAEGCDRAKLLMACFIEHQETFEAFEE